ncbi:MAG: N-acetyltransferase [Myxococcales bacterium]|nr:N-acetyltransferase [Myxococcales bacterium]
MKPFSIRPVEERDAAAICGIYGEAVRTTVSTWEYEAPDEAEILARLRGIVGDGYPYLVAEVEPGEPIVGYAYASRWRARSGYRFTAESSVYVDAACRRRGVGRALVDALVDACRARGLRQLVAGIGDLDNDASIALHRACGFVDVGVFRGVGWKFGRPLDALWMQRSLTG